MTFTLAYILRISFATSMLFFSFSMLCNLWKIWGKLRFCNLINVNAFLSHKKWKRWNNTSKKILNCRNWLLLQKCCDMSGHWAPGQSKFLNKLLWPMWGKWRGLNIENLEILEYQKMVFLCKYSKRGLTYFVHCEARRKVRKSEEAGRFPSPELRSNFFTNFCLNSIEFHLLPW